MKFFQKKLWKNSVTKSFQNEACTKMKLQQVAYLWTLLAVVCVRSVTKENSPLTERNPLFFKHRASETKYRQIPRRRISLILNYDTLETFQDEGTLQIISSYTSKLSQATLESLTTFFGDEIQNVTFCRNTVYVATEFVSVSTSLPSKACNETFNKVSSRSL